MQVGEVTGPRELCCSVTVRHAGVDEEVLNEAPGREYRKPVGIGLHDHTSLLLLVVEKDNARLAAPCR